MEVKLTKRPKNPIIIEGFPGFGLVSTIACEFLIDHLKTELIGKIILEELPAMAAIHENEILQPLGLYYNKRYNLIILHAITASTGFEWLIANALLQLAKQLKSKEIICIEGVGSTIQEIMSSRTFFYTNQLNKKKKFMKIGIKPLKEGIILGVTGAILVKAEKIPVSCIFAETHSELPDSKAAAKIIEALDKYLGLSVDYKPLLKQAERFEKKLRQILEKSKEANEISETKRLSYVG